MLSQYEAICYELLRPGQVKVLRDQCPIAYIPAGSLEWHSFHNPLGTDALKAHAVCCEAALKHGGVVLPPIYRGLTLYNGSGNGIGWGPEGWEGFTLGFNTPDMFDALTLGTARALVSSEWKVLVAVSGHDEGDYPQRTALQRAIDEATRGKNATGFALIEGELHTPNQEIPFGMDHGAAWETSCMMYTYPDKVDLNALRSRQLSSDEYFEQSGPEGMGGKNPLKHASADLGRKIIEKMGDLIGAKAKAALRELNDTFTK